jgi:hypothetical protein
MEAEATRRVAWTWWRPWPPAAWAMRTFLFATAYVGTLAVLTARRALRGQLLVPLPAAPVRVSP